MDFKKLTASNIMLFAAKHYDNPSCIGQAEFLDDMKRFKYVKRLFRKYSATGELRTRLIINHIVVLTNVFGVDAATTMLFFKGIVFFKEAIFISAATSNFALF